MPAGYGYGFPPPEPYPYPYPPRVAPEEPDAPPAAEPSAEPLPPPADAAEPGIEPLPAEEPPAGEPAAPELYEQEAYEHETPTVPVCSHPLVHTAMPRSGAGFYSYARAGRRFAMAEVVDALVRVAAGWASSYPRGPRIGMGDLSFRCGGLMPPHKSHQRGVDIDIRPVRSDGREGPVTYNDPGYSRRLTQDLVNRLRANGRLRVQYIFFNDPAVTGVRNWPGHHNHLHVRFLPPPGVTPELEMPELASELELAKRGPVAATLSWRPIAVTEYPPNNIPAGQGGLYIVERQGRPIYVGETGNFQQRWRGRLLGEWQIGRIDPGRMDRPLNIWFGTLSPRTANEPLARRGVEHAIIRTLSKGDPNLRTGSPGALRNLRSFREFDVVAPMNITELLPRPYVSRITNRVEHFQNNRLSIPAGAQYELLFREGSYELAP